MCDLGHPHPDAAFGYLVDTPEIRGLVAETRRLTAAHDDVAARLDALRPAFAALLAAEGWLPEPYGAPDLASGMGSGIGQWSAEATATFGLVLLIVLGVRKQSPGLPAAVAVYIVGAYWFTASTSFANPAVTIARSLSNTFAGIAPVDAPAFIVAQIVGALLALAAARALDRAGA